MKPIIAVFCLAALAGCAVSDETAAFNDNLEYRTKIEFDNMAAKCADRGGRLHYPPATGSRVNRNRMTRTQMRDAKCRY